MIGSINFFCNSAAIREYANTIRDLQELCSTSEFPPSSCSDSCKSILIDKDLIGHSCLNTSIFHRIARNNISPPFTPFETASVLANIERCKMEIYTIALQQAGLFQQLNRTLAEKFGYRVQEKCNAITAFQTNVLLTVPAVFMISFILV